MNENKPSCRCNCGYTCGRSCGLPIDECIKKHYVHDCDHIWDGEGINFDNGGTVTCSICDMSAINHDFAYGI